MEIINKRTIVNKIKVAIFDFDGTISTLRKGWENLMGPLMLEMICPNREPTEDLINEVKSYIDESTGIQTIFQMEWLAEKVKDTGIATEFHDAWWYKDQYNARLLKMVNENIDLIKTGKKTVESFRIKGSFEFLKNVAEQGVKIYIASGTDDVDLQKEISIIGIADYVYDAKGAPHRQKDCSKEKVLKDILESGSKDIEPNQIAIFGDGKVEIQLAAAAGALAVGTATNEDNRSGINDVKRKKLITAGADIIIGDFLDTLGLSKVVGL